jgi:hypothetical protein
MVDTTRGRESHESAGGVQLGERTAADAGPRGTGDQPLPGEELSPVAHRSSPQGPGPGPVQGRWLV